MRIAVLSRSSWVNEVTARVIDRTTGSGAEEDDSFESFYAANRPRLYRALVALTGRSAEAEDIVQQAFVNVWERWDRVRTMDDAQGYLFRTGMNLFRSRYRSALRAARLRLVRRDVPDPIRAVEVRDQAFRALREVPPRQRAALVLVEILDCSTEEAARLLGIQTGAVRTLVARGRANLAEILEADDD